MDGTRSALIIASDQYADPGLRRLRAPAVDARALAGVLRDPGIGGFEVRTLLNEPAHVVSLAVEEFFADRRPGDLLLVHFSGHGVKDQDGELYLAAPNTILGRLGATAVAAEFVSRRMSRSRSRRVVLLLDCRYAGAFERGLVARAGAETGIGQQFGGRGRAVITASSAMEYAFEAGELADARELSPSVFTSALVEGLETGEADRDQDGLVGLDELYDYVYDKVRAATPNQTPGKWVFGMEGELYIARRSHPVTTPAPLPAGLQQAIDSPLAGIRAGAVQELAAVLRGRHAGMALAARLALEQLTGDDSRAVAAAATAALGAPVPVPPAPSRPELALSATVIDLGRLLLHGKSPERRVRIGNACGGDLNARAVTSASWLKLRQDGDELVVAADTSKAGQYEGTVTVDSDGGTATIRVQARVDPAPPPARGAAATPHSAPVPETPAGAGSGPQQDPAPATASPATADAVPPVTQTAPAPEDPAAGQVVAGPDAGPAAPPDAARLSEAAHARGLLSGRASEASREAAAEAESEILQAEASGQADGMPEATVAQPPVYMRTLLYGLAGRGISTAASEELAAAAGEATVAEHGEGLTATSAWKWRAIIAIIVGVAFTILESWRLGLTLAVVAGIADTIYRSRKAIRQPGAQVTSAQRKTRRQLVRLERAGYRAMHRGLIPDSEERIDHLVVGPAGVYAIDSEAWGKRMPVRIRNAKQLWHGPTSKKERLEHARWKSERAAELLSRRLGHPVAVRPAMAVYGPKIPREVATIRDVDVFSGPRLRQYLRHRVLHESVRLLSDGEIDRTYAAAHAAFPYPNTG